jgi:hypothetical protein
MTSRVSSTLAEPRALTTGGYGARSFVHGRLFPGDGKQAVNVWVTYRSFGQDCGAGEGVRRFLQTVIYSGQNTRMPPGLLVARLGFARFDAGGAGVTWIAKSPLMVVRSSRQYHRAFLRFAQGRQSYHRRTCARFGRHIEGPAFLSEQGLAGPPTPRLGPLVQPRRPGSFGADPARENGWVSLSLKSARCCRRGIVVAPRPFRSGAENVSSRSTCSNASGATLTARWPNCGKFTPRCLLRPIYRLRAKLRRRERLDAYRNFSRFPAFNTGVNQNLHSDLEF